MINSRLQKSVLEGVSVRDAIALPQRQFTALKPLGTLPVKSI